MPNNPCEEVTVTGMKHDSEKPMMNLISPLALTYLGHVLTFGARKYAGHNWRKGIPMDKLIAASLRHLLAMLGGEIHDRETGLPHAAHLMCEAMFIIEQQCSDVAGKNALSFQYSDTQKNLLAALLANAPDSFKGNPQYSSIHP